MRRDYSQIDRSSDRAAQHPPAGPRADRRPGRSSSGRPDMGLGATDEEVRDRIVAYPAFQRDGQFVGYRGVQAGPRLEPHPARRVREQPAAGDRPGQGRPAPDVRGHGRRRRRSGTNYRKTKDSAKIEYLVPRDADKIEVADKPDAADGPGPLREGHKAPLQDPREPGGRLRLLQERRPPEGGRIDPIRDREATTTGQHSPVREPGEDQGQPDLAAVRRQGQGPVQAEAEDVRSRPRRARISPPWPRPTPRTTRPRPAATGACPHGRPSRPGRPRKPGRSRPARVSGVLEVEDGSSILKVTAKTAEVDRPLGRGPDHGPIRARGPEGPRAGRERAGRLETSAQSRKASKRPPGRKGSRSRPRPPSNPATPSGISIPRARSPRRSSP